MRSPLCPANAMTDPIRLSKRLIELVGCSRREAELYIEGGWVTVDGTVVEEPQFKVLDEKVELLPDADLSKADPVTLLLNLPVAANPDTALQLISPASLSSEHREGTRPLKGHFARLDSALPLQSGAGGLLVFTQDWRTLRKLTDDAGKLEQEYVVEVSGEIAPHGLNRMNQGQLYKGQSLAPVKASWQSENRLRLAVKNPAPGLIANLCASVGLTIISMKRLRIGGVSLRKMDPGHWRYLAAGEKF
ncbi:23S rRNA pseudouridine2604 synthase [Pseudomonas pohangensis]|uniref:Dual-specificity RNA pseudouridine synthase RluF n=2 Tax=Pseudomonas pohangensis TaxID=364197 RepID=A0A1H2E950_9PSED|nr:23S rRNA pseudouridine2604 synthase [Pseudomonas pohangensis]